MKWLIPVLAVFIALAGLIAIVTMSGNDSGGDDSDDSALSSSGQIQDSNDNDPHSTSKPTVNPDKRTIMIYIVGSDLESQYGNATMDIQEMLDADIDDSKLEVLLCAGGAASWDNNTVSVSETSYYQVTDDDVTKVKKVNKQNMGLSSTLSDFLNWGVSNHPADSYSLFFWNHGGGPMVGYGIDELSGDSLDLEELVEALEDSPFDSGSKLEILGFDACLMGSVETAWVFRNYAQYFVASQEIEPGFGWDYEFLSRVPSCRDGGNIGKEIIDSYFDFYDALSSVNPRFDADLTLSCVDLSKIGEVESGINQLFAVVNQDVLNGQLATVSRCRHRSKAFGKTGSVSYYDLIDLKHLTSLLSSTYSQAANLETALSIAVVYTKSNVRNANGLSIYHPYDNLTDPTTIKSTYYSFDFAEKYYDYISNFMSGMSSGSQSQSSYRDFSKTMGTTQPNGEKSDLSIRLTDEQMKTFSGAQYYVFWEIPSDVTFSGKTEYLQVFSGQDVELADGKLMATYDGKAVFGKDLSTGTYSDCPLSMNQIYDGSLEEKYYFPCMFWYFGEDFEMDLTPANWLMKIKDGVPTLLQAYPMTGSTGDFPEKQLLDPEDYNVYSFSNNSYFVSTDASGNTVFTSSGSSYGFEYDSENGFDIELRPIPDKSQYRAVFLIEDIYGNRYFSDFIPLA